MNQAVFYVGIFRSPALSLEDSVLFGDRRFVDGIEYDGDEFLRKTVLATFLNHGAEDAIPTGCLDNRNVVGLLELPYLSGDFQS